jgi:hypothetical protein
LVAYIYGTKIFRKTSAYQNVFVHEPSET